MDSSDPHVQSLFVEDDFNKQKYCSFLLAKKSKESDDSMMLLHPCSYLLLKIFYEPVKIIILVCRLYLKGLYAQSAVQCPHGAMLYQHISMPYIYVLIVMQFPHSTVLTYWYGMDKYSQMMSVQIQTMST